MNNEHTERESIESQVKFQRPEITLIDIDGNIERTLIKMGYNVSLGTFGNVYRINRDMHEVVLPYSANLPMITDMDIVIVDLKLPEEIEPEDYEIFEKYTSKVEFTTRVFNSRLNTRYFNSSANKDLFDQILNHGGIFVIFSAPPYIEQEFAVMKHDGSYRYYKDSTDITNNWDFLSIFKKSYFRPKYKMGKRINVTDFGKGIGVDKYLRTGSYYSVLDFASDQWQVLSENKFGEPISACYAHKVNDNINGFVFVFPDIDNKLDMIKYFVEQYFPRIAPHLYEDERSQNWLYDENYELPEILTYRQRINNLTEDFDRQISEIEDTIKESRLRLGFIYSLLTETGDLLVESVKQTLHFLGFQNVINLDEEYNENRREDLRLIEIGKPLLLIEIKGIVGHPSEEDSLQVRKYIAPRMNELKRFDIQGLSIINHQRLLPPLQREDTNVFQPDVIITASEDANGIGLLTTWDLYKVVRSYIVNDWKFEHIRDIFYKKGRINILPSHYTYLGNVEHVWKRSSAFGITLQSDHLKVGDIIAFEFESEYREIKVNTLKVHDVIVELSTKGQEVGIESTLTNIIKKGIRVFKVIYL